MMFCDCAHRRPMCQMRGCEPLVAVVSVLMPYAKRDGIWYFTAKFMCEGHYKDRHKALNTPLRGLDPLPGAAENWRPSISDIIRHAKIAMSFEDRKTGQPVQSVPRARKPCPLPAKFIARLEELTRR